MDMYALGVDPRYRHQGLAQELVHRALFIARNAGCNGAFITATNKITGHIAEKVNMKLYNSVAWKDYKDPICGRKWFSSDLDSEYVDLYFKMF